MISSPVPYRLFRFCTFDLHSSSSSICDRSVATRSGRWHAGVCSSRHEIRGDDEHKSESVEQGGRGESVDLFFAGRHALQLTGATLDFSGSGWAMDWRN